MKPKANWKILRLLAKHGYPDKDESKFAKEVLEIDSSQLTEEEKERIFQITNRYQYCLEILRSHQ